MAVAEAGEVSFQDFHFSSSYSKASPNLMLACATGKHIATARLSLAQPTDTAPSSAAGGSSDFLKYELTNVFVSSYQTGGTLRDDGTYSPIGVNGDGFTGDSPVDQFTLNFAKLEIVYTSQVDGSTADLAAGVGDLRKPLHLIEDAVAAGALASRRRPRQALRRLAAWTPTPSRSAFSAA